MLALITGLIAGVGHVLSGPDHWVAVAPLSVHRPLRALQIGFRWGLGHGAGVLGLGLFGIWLRDSVSMADVSSVAEVAVGVVLVATGAWAIFRSRTVILHNHPHDHSTAGAHSHLHVHFGQSDHSPAAVKHSHGHTAMGLGLLQGVAGSGHLWGLLPALALERGQAVLYLTAFVVGSTLAMMVFSYGISRLASRGSKTGLRYGLRTVGTIAIAVGIYWFLGAVTA